MDARFEQHPPPSPLSVVDQCPNRCSWMLKAPPPMQSTSLHLMKSENRNWHPGTILDIYRIDAQTESTTAEGLTRHPVITAELCLSGQLSEPNSLTYISFKLGLLNRYRVSFSVLMTLKQNQQATLAATLLCFGRQ